MFAPGSGPNPKYQATAEGRARRRLRKRCEDIEAARRLRAEVDWLATDDEPPAVPELPPGPRRGRGRGPEAW